ncbi:MAG: selenide, water dikinase SelD [Verrucomicrobiota bacterium]
MGQGVLARILSALPPPADPRVLIGSSHADDGGVYRVSEREALIASVDFFTPVVDDPYDFGAVAAANSLSDIYAMGGEPLFALAVAAFPDDEKTLPFLADVMAGAIDKAKEAGICVLGGHTIKDREPKFGLSVIGTVHPDRIWHNRGAKAGDILVLTKPIGTGVATSAIKWGICPKATEAAVISSMSRLNAGAGRAGREAGVSTATDVTGFGLLGHLLEVLDGSGLSAEVRYADVPVFPGVRELLRQRHVGYLSGGKRFPGSGWVHRAFGQPPIPGGARDNLAHQAARVRFPQMLSPEEALLLADPQTSGGLLMFVPEDRADALCDALRREGEGAWRVGRTYKGRDLDVQRITVI